MEPHMSVTPTEQLNWYTDRVIAWALSNDMIAPQDRTEALEQLLTIDEESYESFCVPEVVKNPYLYLEADRTLIKDGLLKMRTAHDPGHHIRFERYPTHQGIRRLLDGAGR